MSSGLTKTKTIVGIDYSLNSPAVCISTNGGTAFSDCYFYYLTSKKKHIGKMLENVIGYEHKEYNTPIERFTNISTWALDTIHKHKSDTAKVFIEGYSFGSKGQAVFQIAENCGILKYRLQMSPSILYDTIVPSIVKKHASGKGNADKQLMYDSFKEHNIIKIDLDFKYNYDHKLELSDKAKLLKHKYTDSHAKQIINIYINILKKYVNLNEKIHFPNENSFVIESMDFVLLERETAYINTKKDSKIVKDGIHILCPTFVFPIVILHKVRADMLKNETFIEIIDEIGQLNDIMYMRDIL